MDGVKSLHELQALYPDCQDGPEWMFSTLPLVQGKKHAPEQEACQETVMHLDNTITS